MRSVLRFLVLALSIAALTRTIASADTQPNVAPTAEFSFKSYVTVN